MSRDTSARGKTKPQDVAWEHGKSIPGNPFGSKCNYCKQVMKSGGVTRLKEHLAWSSPNVRNCPKVPKEVRTLMRELIQSSASGRRARKQKEKEIAAELGGFHYDVDVDVDVDEGGDEGEWDEREQLRRAMEAGRAEQWGREEEIRLERGRPSFHGSTREVGGGSMRGGFQEREKQKGGLKKFLSRSTSMRGEQPKLYGQIGGAQKKMTQMYKKGKDSVKNLGTHVARFFIYGAVPLNLADSVPFKNMIQAAQMAGENVPPPSAHQIGGTYLDQENVDMKDWIKGMTHTWETYGLAVMCDGWTGPTKLSIINFMTYCRGTTVFCKSVDASKYIKDASYIQKLIEKQIESLGSKYHVVQIITDNGSAFKKAGKELEKKLPLYWTPCAAHCIDLILEDVGRRPSVRSVIEKGRQITKFIYNHSWVKALFHESSEYGREIVRPGKTRFATNYIALDSLWNARQALHTAFNTDVWHDSRYAHSKEGMEVERIIMTASFWDKVRWVLSILEPIYRVLRVVDNETYPNMGSLYEAFQFMKESINKNVRGGQWVFTIIEDRWKNMLRHPLHAAAYFLNPKYHYERGLGSNIELNSAVFEVFEKLFPNHPNTGDFGTELMAFREARGIFGKPVAVQSRSRGLPCEWWNLYGIETPTLRLLAVRVLSQTVSSSPCERNWSTFSLIHTQRRNRMGYEKLKKLVFCYYNMRLRERLLRDENREATDPLDLMIIGQYAHMEGDDTREDPLYEWLRSEDLDEDNGGPAEVIAQEVRAQGVDVEGVLQRERSPEEFFDPLSRSQTQSISRRGSSDSSSSKTLSGDGGGGGNIDEEEDNDSDEGDDGGINRSPSSYPQTEMPLSPFTCEERYTHATQDQDHGARPSIRRYERRTGNRKGKEPAEANALTNRMTSVDLCDTREESSSGFWRSIPQNFSHEWYHPSSQPTQQPYGYSTSSDYPESGADSSSSYNIFGEYPYGQISYGYDSTYQQDNDELEEPARHSTWY